MIGVRPEVYRQLKKAIRTYKWKYDDYDRNISFNEIISEALKEAMVEWEDK